MFLICVFGDEQGEKRCLLGECCASAAVCVASCSRFSHWSRDSVRSRKVTVNGTSGKVLAVETCTNSPGPLSLSIITRHRGLQNIKLWK